MAAQTEKHLDLFNTIVSNLSPLQREDQIHIINSVVNWLQLEEAISLPGTATSQPAPATAGNAHAPVAAVHGEQTPKEFMISKNSQTNVERVACLAYYLTHFRDTAHFKTLDLSRLNTESAQPKFANASMTVNDAAKSGLLVAAGKGNKQLSALGEQFVAALPDREAAKEILKNRKPRRKSGKRKATKK